VFQIIEYKIDVDWIGFILKRVEKCVTIIRMIDIANIEYQEH